MITSSDRPLSVVIVGAGPRGTGILERLLANVGELLPSRRLHIDLVDPFPAGAGRVWRSEQPSLMLMNVASRNVTMFPDETVQCAGPIRSGPSLHEWAGTVNGCPDVVAGTAFANRATQGHYLAWVLDQVISQRPDLVAITVHQTAAERIDRRPDGRQRVWLVDRDEPLVTDVVVLAVGHLEAEPAKEELLLADFADRHGLCYMPPCYTADVDLSVLRPGEKVAVRGFGLAFVDLMVLLTQERGGRFVPGEGGRLRYLPSGQEPLLYVGSRRGVPYRAKIDYGLAGSPAQLPRFFSAALIAERFADRDRLDFCTDLWPSIAKEVAWGYYHELFTAFPERVTMGWPQFAAAFAELTWGEPAMSELIAGSVPAVADRLNLDALDAPLSGAHFDCLDDLHEQVYRHVVADVERMTDPQFSAELGAYLAMLSVHAQLSEIIASGKLSARAYIQDLRGWWFRFFEYASSGPPSSRLREMLALSEAGIVRFIGPGIWIKADEQNSRFLAGGMGVEEGVETTALVDARLPSPTLHTSTSTLLRGLYKDHAVCGEVLSDEDGYSYQSGVLQVSEMDFRILDACGLPQRDRFALGPYTSVRHFATFARPRSNALSFRQNDVLASSLLRFLADERLGRSEVSLRQTG
ncbi:MAG: FAD/NAD(P)-binding protein [Sciscionella sp.]